jgi:hypothetical protein
MAVLTRADYSEGYTAYGLRGLRYPQIVISADCADYADDILAGTPTIVLRRSVAGLTLQLGR